MESRLLFTLPYIYLIPLQLFNLTTLCGHVGRLHTDPLLEQPLDAGRRCQPWIKGLRFVHGQTKTRARSHRGTLLKALSGFDRTPFVAPGER